MGQDERLKENQKSEYEKIVKWKKTICKSQEEKLEKH